MPAQDFLALAQRNESPYIVAISINQRTELARRVSVLPEKPIRNPKVKRRRRMILAACQDVPKRFHCLCGVAWHSHPLLGL